MATIKATYESTTRRFTISPDITWSNLVSQLHNLFQIPSTTPINVSYTDEDDDVISVSSDLELQEVLSLHSAGKVVRLLITTKVTSNVFSEIGKTTEVLEQLSIGENKNLGGSSHVKESEEETKTSGKSPSAEETEDEDDEPTIIFIRTSRPFRLPHCLRYLRHSSPNFYQPYMINRSRCGRFSSVGPSNCEYYQQKQSISSEQLAENIKTLNSMGFPSDDKKYERLLKRYNGHVDRVVDILLRERCDDKSSEKQQEVRSESSTQAMMEVDVEKKEERPYVLYQ